MTSEEPIAEESYVSASSASQTYKAFASTAIEVALGHPAL
jgi:hypothetical protein